MLSDAYVAGLVDGEGYITISVVKRKKNTRVMRPYFAIAMHPEARNLLIEVQEWAASYNVKLYLNEYSNRHGGWSLPDSRIIRLSTISVFGVPKLCQALLPHLRLKREQAERIVEYGKGRPRRGDPRKFYTDHDFELAELCRRLPQIRAAA